MLWPAGWWPPGYGIKYVFPGGAGALPQLWAFPPIGNILFLSSMCPSSGTPFLILKACPDAQTPPGNSHYRPPPGSITPGMPATELLLVGSRGSQLDNMV